VRNLEFHIEEDLLIKTTKESIVLYEFSEEGPQQKELIKSDGQYEITVGRFLPTNRGFVCVNVKFDENQRYEENSKIDIYMLSND